MDTLLKATKEEIIESTIAEIVAVKKQAFGKPAKTERRGACKQHFYYSDWNLVNLLEIRNAIREEYLRN